MGEGYYVYSYDDVCMLLEGARGTTNVDNFLYKSLTNTPALKKKNHISYSHARVYIFHLEFDVSISRATGGFKSLTTKILQQSHC